MNEARKERREVHYLPISAIDVGTSAVRKFFDTEKLKEMSLSIKDRGVLQSIIVRPRKKEKNKFEVVMGMRRLKAALLAGRKEVPCVIEDVDDKEALVLALTENIQREDLTPLEEGLGILKLMKEHDFTQKQVCLTLKKTDPWVRTRIKMLSLPEEVQKSISQGELSAGHAEILASLDSPEKQTQMAKSMISEALTANDAKEMIKASLFADRGVGLRRQGRKKKEMILWKAVEFQSEKLRTLLESLNISKLSFPVRQEIKKALSELKKAIGKVIQDIDYSD